MSSFKNGWYVIYTRPRHEKKVAGKLAETGINIFLPTRKQIRIWNDRKKCIEEPLFPSYVFVYLDGLQSYYAALGLEGVLYYVKTGKEVARVSESIVNDIRLITDQAKDLEVTDDYFQPGQKLVISQGALTGLNCEIVQSNGKQRVLVRVDLLQRNILLTLSTEHLAVV